MKKRILVAVMLLSGASAFSQKVIKKEGRYNARLVSVENNAEYQTIRIDTTLSVYDDENIYTKWAYAGSNMQFDIMNKTAKSIKIIWDEAAFIFIDNTSSRVIHKSSKLSDREAPQTPTMIYKGAVLSENAVPASNVMFIPSQYGGWSISPIIPMASSLYVKKITYKPELLNKTIKVILPIVIDGNTIEYTFVFKTEFIEKIKL